MSADVVVNPLEMSDEDFLKMPPPGAVAAESKTETPPSTDGTGEGEGETGTTGEDTVAAGGAGDEVVDEAAQAAADAAAEAAKVANAAADVRAKGPDGKFLPKAGAKDAVQGDAKAASEAAAAAAATAAAAKTGDDKTVTEKPAAAVNYQAEYERLLTPFKANGREVKVDTVDDAIALMQMGANYNKKMQALKPNLKLLKSLEVNGLLDEGKISFLIDVAKKNPAAIQKLVSESGIDPMEFDAEKAKSYKATSYTVDDREIELDTILEDLRGSPAYTQVLDVVSNKWDLASKQAISASPQLLQVIHDHVAGGVYDIISKEMDKERMLGRLKGMSDIEAYKHVGDAIHARGGFSHLVPKGNTPPASTTTKAPPAVVTAKPKAVEPAALNDKRRAASSTKPVAPVAKGFPKDFNPLAMSDEEFTKMATPKFT